MLCVSEKSFFRKRLLWMFLKQENTCIVQERMAEKIVCQKIEVLGGPLLERFPPRGREREIESASEDSSAEMGY